MGEKNRRRGRPETKWRQDMERKAGILWRREAENRIVWKGHVESYISMVLNGRGTLTEGKNAKSGLTAFISGLLGFFNVNVNCSS